MGPERGGLSCTFVECDEALLLLVVDATAPRHAGHRLYGQIHFLQLHPMPLVLDLVVLAAAVEQLPRVAVSAQIARAVNAIGKTAMQGVLGEHRCCALLVAHIPQSKRHAAHEDLPCRARLGHQ